MLKKELRNVSAVPLTEALGKLGRMDSAAFETAWNSIARITEEELGSDDVDRVHVLSLLKDLRARPELGALLAGFATTAIRTRKDIILEGLLEAFGEELMANDAVRSDLNGLVAQAEPPPSIGLLLAYLARHLDEKLWNTILSRADTSTLPQLLAFQAAHPAVNSLRPQGTELDALFQSMLDAVLSGTSPPDVTAQLLAKPEPFISPAALAAAEERIASCVSLTTDAVLRDPSVDVTPARSAIALLHARAWSGVRPKAFVLARLVPNSLPNVVIALDGEEERDAVLHTLHDLLLDTSVLATPAQILDTALRTTAGPQRVMNLLFPPASELERMRVEAARVPYPPSYAVVEPLAASTSTSAASSVSVAKKSVDSHGKTAYTRLLEALVPFLCTERSLARENPWIIAHVALLPSTLDVDTLAAYLLAPPDDGWHIRVADAITKPAGSLNDALADVLVHIVRNCATPREAVGLGKLLKRLLNGAEVNEAEAWTRAARSLERSTPLASHAILRTISSTALEPPLLARYRTELAATLAGVPPAKCNTEGLRLLRALNAAAPDASGDAALVPQQRAVFLMKTIERWIEDADEIDEEVESGMTELFVSLAPVLQSVPGKHWETVLDLIENGLESTDMGEEDELLSLARTLRLLASVIELAASTKMLRQEYWALREKKIMALVLRLLEAQGSGDKDSAARAACKELLISLAAHIPSASLDPDTLSKTVHLLASNNVAVLQAAYPFLQQAAAKRTEYLVIESAASTLTVEATAAEDGVRTPAFDEPVAPKIELPVELLALVQLQLEVELDDGADGELLSTWQSMLFAWMLIFDCFVDASAKVKAGFVEQLRDLDLVELYFAPNVLGLLGVMHSGGGGSSARKSFKLDVWAIEEFFLSLYDPRTTLSPRLLSAHLFFRALESTPTLIRGWFLKSKDRQLHTAVSAYISSYFSPPLIATALQPLRALPSDSELKADGWALRVGGGGSEALLSYTVDEQSLEVALRLPPEWPLKGAEVREVRKVGGIPENRWRAWTFGLAQNAAGDGGVLEGLRNFRKNVAGHFDGQVECAICYCIISVTDQSLPTKPCRTCKNRFHASCLYKWFKSSHASTCPLCRSDIL
ncbi:hypothetical protein EXIGLDRAFT_661699 [Exidia glandulosa HHB12029]|uniref:E3 ubiquitin-protein ligase listerin n=1 Tax=Exidia glandulosa HHB12029 TaxID=1314781 RepID=A0A166NAN0_EXIGL|nr:hypothetical protein EXIGLDRAFT_661699 [Exidia glandulosa HHB12029]